MLSLTGNILIVILTMGASLLFMVGLNRIWPVTKRHSQNDLVGWQLSVLGTTYAVTLGFMLYTEWGDFKSAELNVELEANSLRNIYRLAQGMPHERAEIEKLTMDYATDAIERDWPEMARAQTPDESHAVNERLWKVLLSAHIETQM